MKITAQEEYGLRCILQLAAAPDHALTIAEIAAAEGLSPPYVAKLLSILRQEGLVESVRGRTGGYRLTDRPERIQLGRVLRALGQPLYDEPNYCQRHAGTETEGHCVHSPQQCSLRALWQTLETWLRQALDQLRVSDLLQSPADLASRLRQRLELSLQELSSPGEPPLITSLGTARLQPRPSNWGIPLPCDS
ncbi:MAG: Rrf2 family transcriptional regulator [Gemmatales bacterium]|nr:Rrf2 family transcriptional regulator [Gemmatales bacterium]MDW7993749.1 Rrf2 family transcriptional regulator [Gemmatales bacterium]